MSPITESRSWRSQASCCGVFPAGAQVLRRTGWSMKPLSSKKTKGTSSRFAPFLFAASSPRATNGWLSRCVRGPAARASGVSTRTHGESSTREPGGTSRGTPWRLPRLPADRSRGRYDNPLSAVRPRVSSTTGASVSDSDGASVLDEAWLSKPSDRPFPRPASIVLRNRWKRPRSRPPRRFSCLPTVTSMPADGELPTRLHFLSVSYVTVRMFTMHGSLTMQGAIIGPPRPKGDVSLVEGLERPHLPAAGGAV